MMILIEVSDLIFCGALALPTIFKLSRYQNPLPVTASGSEQTSQHSSLPKEAIQPISFRAPTDFDAGTAGPEDLGCQTAPHFLPVAPNPESIYGRMSISRRSALSHGSRKSRTEWKRPRESGFRDVTTQTTISARGST
jgi:hypothetical protein